MVIIPGLKRRKLIKVEKGLKRDKTEVHMETLVKIEPYTGALEQPSK